MLFVLVASTGQCIAGLGHNAAIYGHIVEIGIFGFLVAVFFFLTTCVFAALLMLERYKRRLAARVKTREVESQRPTTYTCKASQPRCAPSQSTPYGRGSLACRRRQGQMHCYTVAALGRGRVDVVCRHTMYAERPNTRPRSASLLLRWEYYTNT